uniref:Uncharacterized protein n=1 Tax=Anguilla anguilla TaxID=7936 RepID=A0A0E9U7H8_ANGAN
MYGLMKLYQWIHLHKYREWHSALPYRVR